MRQIGYSYLRKLWPKKTNFGHYNIVTPGKVSPSRTVPANITKPIYYETGIPPPPLLYPEIKNEIEIKKMRTSCKLAANILNEVGKVVHVGGTNNRRIRCHNT